MCVKKQEFIWCPYTSTELPKSKTTSEHVIPLALGGHNAFTVPVCARKNSDVGGTIDGAFANEPYIAMLRVVADARGHNGEPPKTVFKKTKLPDGSPASLTVEAGMFPVLRDSKTSHVIDAKELGGATLKHQLLHHPMLRERFMAKVALSAGQFVYGELFREVFSHDVLRAVMDRTDNQAIVGHPPVILVDGFRLSERHTVYGRLEYNRSLVGYGTFVSMVPVAEHVLVSIGVLGQWLGALRVPADSSRLPVTGDHAMGHIIMVGPFGIHRQSYLSWIQDEIAKHEPPNSLGDAGEAAQGDVAKKGQVELARLSP